ncbi:uncharacterized protein CELE_F18E2.15 [Caenorhabditis elegans]|uniref:Uncharacterized protein n=1 Tax=Caenorhabditis elegans TaxID=6239 RepID=H9G2Y6_CAEEL|nr:Uncharacterized protein CELE_F18E2.15 [Caenorhabditis elegans]CCG28101.1 Uncharacterized protein CELE_F18E2.15 [Caenorhabditis elegans]|eukprot:NP_001256454.1 Uncharacterized protein CELE_F18E2.15 [Caenorhabditis elegans]
MSSVEKLLRQGQVNQEDLLTERADNLLNEFIRPEDSTYGDTKGKKEETKTSNTIRVRRTMSYSSRVLPNHCIRCFSSSVHPSAHCHCSRLLWLLMNLFS